MPSSGTSISEISLRTSSSPPTSDQETLGISTSTSLMPLGSTSLRASVKSSMETFMFSSI